MYLYELEDEIKKEHHYGVGELGAASRSDSQVASEA